MIKIRKIAFDFDGVIAATNESKKQWFLERNIKIDKTDKTSIYKELRKILEIDEVDNIYKEMSKNIFTKEILEKTKPIKGSIETIKQLSKKYEIYIITARTNKLIEYAKEWLQKYNIDKNIKEIISSSYEPKQTICKRKDIFFLCDDDIRHLQQKIINTRVLFNQEQIEETKKNKTQSKDPKIIEIKSWSQIRDGSILLPDFCRKKHFVAENINI